MNIKRLVKTILMPIQCIRFGIKNRSGFLYIGKACKLVNAKQMWFAKNVSIMPYSMLICHRNGKLSIGENSQIGMFSRIGCQGQILIGNNVLTGPHIFIADYNHEYRNPDVPVMYQGNLVKITSEFDGGGVL